jgi:aminopeptidase N
MYYKGGNMLHTLRQIVNDDEKWRGILRGMNKDFYHQVVKGSQVENYLSEKTGMHLKSFFNQYLRDTRIPVFEYSIKGNDFIFRWNNCVPGFNMPLKIYISGKEQIVKPTPFLTSLKLDIENAVIKVDPEYYIAILNITGQQGSEKK